MSRKIETVGDIITILKGFPADTAFRVIGYRCQVEALLGEDHTLHSVNLTTDLSEQGTKGVPIPYNEN